MIFQKANQFLRKGKMQEALKEYKKIKTDSPLYQQAKFNIDFIEKKLSDSGIQLSIVQKSYGNISTDCEGPLVSVVMPVYNVAPYLDASILSVLNQTYQNIELIIVDDASTDNGMNIIKMYERQDNRIKVISLEFNTLGGAGIPSNIGVSASTGKYIAYADSDDILNKDAIANFVKAAEENNAEVVVADFSNFDDNLRVFETAYDKSRWSGLPLDTVINPTDYPSILSISPVPWRKLYKREFLENNNIRFPEGDYFYEDNPLHWFVLSKAKRIVMIDVVVAYHRMAREGQTMSADKYKLAAHFCHLNSILRFYIKDSEPVVDVFWEELLKRILSFKWVVKKADNNELKATFEKRISQLLSNTLKSSNLALNQVNTKLPELLPIIDEYSLKRENIDLSVIIPVYNCEDLLDETLNTLTKFRKIKVEVLLIDDGSTDNSYDICKSYADRYNNFYAFSQKNKGAGVARNALIPLITGKYTYFLDADDTVNVDSLENALIEADTNNNDLLFVKYNIQFYDAGKSIEMFESDSKIWEKLLLAKDNREMKLLVAGLINYPWNRLISTRLLHDENIFFGKTIVHNDVPYHWHSIISATNIGILDETVCSHRKFEEREQITNITDSRRMMVLEAYRYTNHVIAKYEDYYLLIPVWRKFITHLLSWAEDKIPENDKVQFNSRRSNIIEDLNKLAGSNIGIVFPNSSTKIGFYRIIGNSIDGLHAENQSLKNLIHILENETSITNFKKVFILNRIIDDNLRKKLIDILNQYDVEYLEIEFDLSKFKRIGYDFNSLPNSYYWFGKKGNWADIVTKTAIRNFKNAYLMNNNGARNFALKHGKSTYDWTMPWDGNCFLSDTGFKELLIAMSDHGDYKYIATPMQRTVEKDIINKSSVITNPIDEPQISFHKYALEFFNEARVYGNQSKVELFKRLGYQGEAWDKLVNLYPWQKLEIEKSIDWGQVVEASGVFRLYSGNTEAAISGKNRSHTRSYGIINKIDDLEATYIEKNFKLFRDKSYLFSEISKLQKKAQLGKISKNLKSESSNYINQLSSKDRAYTLIFSFSQDDLSFEIASAFDMGKHYYKQGINLSDVDKFCAVLNNLTSALICSLVTERYSKAVKIKIDLAMLMNYYYSTINQTKFDSSNKARHIKHMFNILNEVFIKVFEYSFYENFSQASKNNK